MKYHSRRTGVTTGFVRRLLFAGLTFSSITLLFIYQPSIIQQRASAQTQLPQASWSTTGSSKYSTSNATFLHGTYTKLHNGSVIATGGTYFNFPEEMRRSVEIYNPRTAKWSDAEPMNFSRIRHSALLLADGRLLVIGGLKPTSPAPYEYAGPPEVFDPSTGKWTVINTSGVDLSRLYTLIPNYPLPVLLPNGKVLLIAGLVGIQTYILNPNDGSVKAGPTLKDVVGFSGSGSNAVVLFDGRVALFGAGKFLIYDLEKETLNEANLPKNNSGVELAGKITTLLPSGEPFAYLGARASQDTPNYNVFNGIFDPGSQAWKSIVPRGITEGFNVESSYSVVLPQGNTVLTIDNDGTNLYNTSTSVWSPTSNYPQGPVGAPVLLADGRVLSGNQLYGIDFGSNNVVPTLVTASAASYHVEPLARGSIASVFGAGIGEQPIFLTFPGVQGDPTAPKTTITVSKVFARTPDQINFLVPSEIPDGQVEMTIGNQKGLLSITKESPGIFTANADGRGMPAAVLVRVKTDGTQLYEPVVQFDANSGALVPASIDLGVADIQVFLVLFGTGWKNRTSEQNTTAYIGGVKANVQYVGAQGDLAGVDQMNILIPRNLSGRGEVDVLVTVDGKTANPVKVAFR